MLCGLVRPWEHSRYPDAIPMPPSLTPDRIANELLVEVLLAQDQMSTSFAVMALEVQRRPEMAPRVRALLGEVLAVVQAAEDEMGVHRVG